MPRRDPSVWAPGAVTRSFPASADGTPIYKQGDAEWGRSRLGSSASIGAEGCLLSSMAMAMSKISGEPITPAQLDAYLDDARGYSGDRLDWKKAAAARDLQVSQVPFSLKAIDSNLEAGRPVVLGVTYKPGSKQTDHWVLVTGRSVDAQGHVSYSANDPGTGKQIVFTPQGKGLRCDGVDALGHYRSSGRLAAFT